MKKPLISENLNDNLNLIVQRCFEGNRLLDRMMSILGVKFVMNQAASILHPLLAHALPIIADKISDYQGSRNALTNYLETFGDNSDYSSLLEIFDKFFEYMLGLESTVKDVIEIAKDEDDIMTKVFLEQFLLGLNEYTNQALLLRDKAELYGEDIIGFDRDIENFIILKNGD